MKILYCVPQLYRAGGIERVVTLKVNSLVEVYGYEVIIVTSDQRGAPFYYPLSNRVKVYDLGIDYDSLLKLPLYRRIPKRAEYREIHKRRLSKLFSDLKVDVVISTFTHEASFLPQIKDGSKKILESHFCRGHKRMMADVFGFSLPTKLAYYFRCWQEENIIIPRYDKFVVLTEEDRDRWGSEVKGVVCIPNISPFSDAEEQRAELTNRQAIAVGRLDAQKGFDRLISIWADVNALRPDWILNIYGAGEDEAKLRRQISDLNLEAAVFINPPERGIKERYLESSIFLMTSRYEGLPMTLLEAQSLALPTVAYDFKCGVRDVVEDNVSGYIVREGDRKMFVSRVLSLIDDPNLRLKMGRNAFEAQKHYSNGIIMKKWIALFDSLLQQ
ncbi:MAG: glycosyltransferase family 4 protein [Rikenellaceae bacterium]